MTRAYEQKARAESAAETRRRILDGVYECLRDEPSTPPSVGEIARRADVARSTVYLAFGSRAGLFDALFAMTKLDPDAVGGAVVRIEGRRADGMAWASRRLARQKQLKPGVSARRAAHVLWLVASFDAFDLLYTGRGLSARETGRILADTFENAVCT